MSTGTDLCDTMMWLYGGCGGAHRVLRGLRPRCLLAGRESWRDVQKAAGSYLPGSMLTICSSRTWRGGQGVSSSGVLQIGLSLGWNLRGEQVLSLMGLLLGRNVLQRVVRRVDTNTRWAC